MQLQLAGHRLQLCWFQQGLVSSALDGLYGREILTRARLAGSDEAVPPQRLFAWLKAEPRRLLDFTIAQVAAVQALDAQWHLDGSLWFNLAGELLAADALFDELMESTLQSLPPEWRRRLVLEISEDALEQRLVPERVEALRQAGFLVAMDDFGAGYSNLGRLQAGGFDILKLDLGLMSAVPEKIWAASFYRQVVELAASTGSQVVAEGVERRTQADFVRWAGVDLIQGFLFSRPQPLRPLRNGGLVLQPLKPKETLDERPV
ncbi:EAL domain-containing protein [Marinobacterium aestuariivivens]|uniref:EAL domain-containing protein n=1 Tax=Marinobacterium aestuariivivens TaxID=1698799 RepID=A0ABW2A2D4_9GAMM